MGNSERFDAVIIGYGPVGATMAGLLARRGWQVAIIDRLPDIYPLPRAVRLDGETMRVFDELGIGDQVHADCQQARGAEFVDAKGKRIQGIDLPEDYVDPSGWVHSNMFYQPLLERTLRDNIEARANVTVLVSHEAGAPEQTDDSVSVDVSPVDGGETFTVEADYLIAADGAASPVRKSLGFTFQSLGYDCDWVVVDVDLKREVPKLAVITQQICDPKRRATYVPTVGLKRRWEFQLLPGENKVEMAKEDKVWEMLAPWVGPEEAEIERSAGYQFHAAHADHWRDRRIFLAGDAAHQTPPFLGEGMVAGVRDAANLAWKLDMVKRGLAPEALLDTYQRERGPHAHDLVDHAVETGKLIDACADAQVTGNWPASYDAMYGGSRGLPHLHGGVLALSEEDPTDGLTGYQAPQAMVKIDGADPALLDRHVTGSFFIVSTEDLSSELSGEQKEFLDRIGATRFVLGEGTCVTPQMDLHLAIHKALIVRPDRYIFGLANDTCSLSGQVNKLMSHFN